MLGAELLDQVLHGDLLTLAAVDHAVDVDAALVRSDQSVGDGLAS